MNSSSRFKFKALELNRKILESALNPKKPAAKEPTRTQGFELQVERRLQQRQASRKPEEEAEEKPYTFHPRPVPTKILEEVVVSAHAVSSRKVHFDCWTIDHHEIFVNISIV